MARQKKTFLLLPVAGTLLFVLLYIIATLYYPGGSQADKNAVGFSWRHNYWCNLLNDTATNGQLNTAKPIALVAMLVLCLTLSSFWAVFPVWMQLSPALKRTIQIPGIGAMLVAFFLFAGSHHDMIVNIATLLGVVATIGIFVALYRARWLRLFGFGLFNILLVGVNNYLYYSLGLITYLPVTQKITFVSFLLWICCVSVRLYKLPDSVSSHS